MMTVRKVANAKHASNISYILGMRDENACLLAFIFSVFSTIQGKTMARPFEAKCSEAIQFHINNATIITGSVPGQHHDMWLSPGQGPISSSLKQWKSDAHVKT